jgi:hypothetical protein
LSDPLAHPEREAYASFMLHVAEMRESLLRGQASEGGHAIYAALLTSVTSCHMLWTLNCTVYDIHVASSSSTTTLTSSSSRPLCCHCCVHLTEDTQHLSHCTAPACANNRATRPPQTRHHFDAACVIMSFGKVAVSSSVNRSSSHILVDPTSLRPRGSARETTPMVRPSRWGGDQ